MMNETGAKNLVLFFWENTDYLLTTLYTLYTMYTNKGEDLMGFFDLFSSASDAKRDECNDRIREIEYDLHEDLYPTLERTESNIQDYTSMLTRHKNRLVVQEEWAVKAIEDELDGLSKERDELKCEIKEKERELRKLQTR